MILYGDETKKALANFGRGETPPELVRALAEVKKTAALAVQSTESRYTEEELGDILSSCDTVIAHSSALAEARTSSQNDQSARFAPSAIDSTICTCTDSASNTEENGNFVRENFPLPLEQGGAGTSLNMNINEVIAALASQKFEKRTGVQNRFHPIEDINRFQSTNDVLTTAVTITVLRKFAHLEESVIAFQSALCALEAKHPSLLMLGRTEMQSALPITLSQLTGSYAGSTERDRWRIAKVTERLRSVALGGTAIGTSFGAPRNYIFKAEQFLREITGLNLSRSQNLPDEISNNDKYCEAAGTVTALAVNLQKFTGDMLIYTSSLCGEFIHPEVQYGSSIMAAKTNPVLLEFSHGLALAAESRAQLVTRYSAAGRLQLNAFLPFAAEALFSSIDFAQRAAAVLAQNFLPLVTIDVQRIERNLYESPVMLNVLVPRLGYTKVKELFREYQKNPPKTRQAFIEQISELSGLTPEEIGEITRPERCASASKS